LIPIIIPSSRKATTRFFEKVKTEESNPLTAKLFRKIENPDIMAVIRTKTIPLVLLSIM
jgi:hypothetical protein